MKSLLDLLTGATLRPLLDKATLLSKLNDSWQAFGRKEWTQFCQVANYEAGVLTLIVPNASWSTRIRYAAPEIIKDLVQHEDFYLLRTVHCKIASDPY
jgi:hypothetical protein